jgi:hypothetical protein
LGIDGDLLARLTDWNDAYAEAKLAIDGPGDRGGWRKVRACWLRSGLLLLVGTPSSSPNHGGATFRRNEHPLLTPLSGRPRALVIPAKIELCRFLDGEDGAVAQAAGLTCS